MATGTDEDRGLTEAEQEELKELNNATGGNAHDQYQAEHGDDPNRIGSGYRPSSSGGSSTGDGSSSSGDDSGGSSRFGWLKRHKKEVAAGGVIGGALITGAVGIMSIGSGPLKFLHIAQLLTSADWASTEDQDDTSVFRIYRTVKLLNKGTPENTRLNALGNKFADRFEARLNSTGISSAYTNIFGHFDGYVIDRSHPEFRGMNDNQLRDHLEKKYGIPKDAVINGSSLSSNPEARGKVVISSQKLGYFKSQRFVRGKLNQAGMGKLSSAVGTRVLKVRTGATLHPLKKLDQKILRGVENAFNKAMRERRNKLLRKGTNTITTESKPGGETEEEKRARAANADANARSANEILEEGKTAGQAAADGNRNALSAFRSSLTAKITLGGAALTTVPCLLRSMDDEAGEIERQKLILPMQRDAVATIAMGEQEKSGHDFDTRQFAFYDKLLAGTDSSGKKTSFSDAQAIKAADGQPDKGYPPSVTLQNIGNGTPFSFLNEPPFDAPLDVACSAAVAGLVLVIAFVGGPVSTAVSTAIGLALVPKIIEAGGAWLSDDPADVINAVGADRGNIMRFGSRLAAGDQALAGGGRALNESEEKELINISSVSQRQEFSEKSLAYRLFSPYDYRTPISRLIDRYGNYSASSNLSDVFSNIANIGSVITNNLGNLLSGRTYAATDTYYKFPFPKVAFSVQEMNDTRFQNPVEVGRAAARLFDSPSGKPFIDRMSSCNAVTIGKDSEGRWNATSTVDKTPTMKAIKVPECGDKSYEWLLTRFFVKYTLNMNSMTCLGGDNESCQYVGFSNG